MCRYRFDAAQGRAVLGANALVVADGTVDEVRAIIGRLDKKDGKWLRTAANFNSVAVIDLLKQNGFAGQERVRSRVLHSCQTDWLHFNRY